MKHKIIISLLVSLLLCSCSSADPSASDRETEITDDHSIDETEPTTGTTAAEMLSSEIISASSEEELSSYFPEILESAAELDSSSTLTDFNRMMKEVASFDGEAFVKDHNYVTDHFTGNFFSYFKLFLIYDRKDFMGEWQYGNYTLNMVYSSVNKYFSFYVENVADLSSGYVPSVVIRCIENDGKKDLPLPEKVTREDLDKTLRMHQDDPDVLTEEAELLPDSSFFDDSLINDEEVVAEFLRDYPE